jgi:hypothetical protein
MNFQHAYLIAFAISVAIISYEDMTQCHRLPWPPRIIKTGLVFALLDVFSIVNEELAGVIAIGIVLAFIVNKGFVADCGNILAKATTQPSTESDADIFLQSPTPSNPSTTGPGNLPPPGPGQFYA